MNWRRYLWLALLLAGIACRAQAGDLLDEIARNVGRFAVVRAEFVQSKEMQALKRPLVIGGRLVVSRNDGVLWKIERPYRMSYVLGEKRIVEIDGNGVHKIRDGRQIPGLAQVGRVFRALFSADADVLRDYFQIEASGSAARWSVELRPKQAQISQFLGRLKISGGRFIEEIRIEETSGDTTTIRFRNTSVAETIDDDEVLLFADAAAEAGR